MHHHAAIIVTTLALMLSCGSATAQWKWRDASGRITASDLPPPSSVPERDVLARPTDKRLAAAAQPASAATAGNASVKLVSAGVDPELEARRKRAAEEQTAQQRQAQARDDAARVENCNRARAQVSALGEGQRMSRINAKGEKEVLDDKGRAEEVQRARSVIASDCK